MYSQRKKYWVIILTEMGIATGLLGLESAGSPPVLQRTCRSNPRSGTTKADEGARIFH
jgi:hypothetical protein